MMKDLTIMRMFRLNSNFSFAALRLWVRFFPVNFTQKIARKDAKSQRWSNLQKARMMKDLTIMRMFRLNSNFSFAALRLCVRFFPVNFTQRFSRQDAKTQRWSNFQKSMMMKDLTFMRMFRLNSNFSFAALCLCVRFFPVNFTQKIARQDAKTQRVVMLWNQR